MAVTLLRTTADATLKWDMYRKEIANYVSTMTIKYSHFDELMQARLLKVFGTKIANPTESPYYLNLAGEYSPLDEQMYVWSLEKLKMVPFNRQLWTDYPSTAGLYTFGSENYIWLCKKYPNQVGLIKQICYPIPSIEEAYAASDFTILRHEPGFLQANEQDILYTAAKEILQYVSERWYIFLYYNEDQYPLVFFSQLLLNLYQGLLKARIEAQDTYAVHSMHVWDRLEANGLLPYESILSDSQARWFYRNMRYLKENRGRKSNLILLADNLLEDLRVHLVGKRIFENTEDDTKDCVIVPEFISDDIVDYSVARATDISTSATAHSEAEFMGDYTGPSNSSVRLADLDHYETMDHILARIHEEGYYPSYSLQDSEDMETTFGKSIVNNVPTRLLELLKYVIHTPYARLLAGFCFDTLMYHLYLGHLDYRIGFNDRNTGLLVSLKAKDAIIFLSYCMYRIFGPDDSTLARAPICIPKYVELNKAYLDFRPADNTLPKHYWWNGFKYNIDTIIKDTQILDEIPWMRNTVYRSAEQFALAIGKQYRARIKHARELYMEMHPAHQWAMCYFYNHILVHGRYTLYPEDCITYETWINETEGVKALIEAYDALIDYRDHYDQLSELLFAKLVPIEVSPDLAAFVGAIYDNTEYYTQFKQLFQEWTGHYLTYLDTERERLTYLEMQPTVACTGEHLDTVITQINTPGITSIQTHVEEVGYTDFTTHDTVPYLLGTYCIETTEKAIDPTPAIDLGHVEECVQNKITVRATEIVDQTCEEADVSTTVLVCGPNLIAASIPGDTNGN